MSTPSTYPPHLACLSCDPAPVFFTLLHLQAHVLQQHPEQVGQPRMEVRMPQRIQRQNGSGLPGRTVWVGPGSRWANPYVVGVDVRSQVEATAKYRWLIQESTELAGMVRKELAGKDLACSCRHGSACHAVMLIEVANEAAP